MKAIKAISALPAARITATTTGAAINLADYIGEMQVVLTSSATEGADHTSNVKLQHCDTATGAFVDCGVAFDQITNAGASFQVRHVNVDGLKKFVRVVNTLAGTTPAVTAAVAIVAKNQSV